MRKLAATAPRLRVVGGRWRGRRLPFPVEKGLRPTADRVREQLFNWLQGELVGARCLDLFAGSGALGIEAASRGAASVLLVDANPRVVRHLDETLETLQSGDDQPVCTTHCGDARDVIEAGHGPWHILFLDPPFDAPLNETDFVRLDNVLEAGGWVYCEHRSGESLAPLPARWTRHREGRAGEASYALFRVAGCAAADGG